MFTGFPNQSPSTNYVADEAWTARYEQELKANEELEIKHNGRLALAFNVLDNV